MKSVTQIIFLSVLLGAIVIFIRQSEQVLAQSPFEGDTIAEVSNDNGEAQTTDDEAEAAEPPPFAEDKVVIHWGEKFAQGGATMIFLLLLSVTGLASFAERLLSVRSRFVAPKGLAEKVIPQLLAKDHAGVRAACKKQPSTLARVIEFIVDHVDNPVETISNGVSDIGGREIRDMLQKTSPLAVVASLAPLLGLLGTMIGMIEAFELVSIYGDDGGASMLAGSIAKALITTAVGLMIAIPAIAAYQYIKHRINHLTNDLETDTESIINHVYLKKPGTSGTPATPGKRSAAAS